MPKFKFDTPGELAHQEALDHNLAMMNTDMQRLLSSESSGGNAGNVKIDGKSFVCVAANSFVDRDSGKVVAFDNIQNVNNEIVGDPQNIEMTFRIAYAPFQILPDNSLIYNSPWQRPDQIISVKGLSEVSEQARDNILVAVEAYNQQPASLVY